MNKNQLRELFPHIKNNITYLNHASTAPISINVKQALEKAIIEKTENKIDNFKGYLKAVVETKELLAELINATPDRIAFADNTTNGINILAQSVNWQKGDKILLNDLEFPANVYPFLNLEKLGVEIDFVKSSNGKVTVDDIINAITPETRLIAVSQVQFLTGFRIDLEKLGMYCKANNILLAVDAIQGLGAVTLDVEKYCIDFLSAGSQKWLLGLQGLSFIFVSKSLQEKMEPKFVGWLSVENAWDLLNYNLKLKETAEAFEGGTLNWMGIFALNASLKLLKEVGFNEVEKNVISNSQYLIEQLSKIGVNSILADCYDKNLAGIVSFKHEQSQEIFEHFQENKISIAVREGMVRLAPHFYNNTEDLDKAVNALKYYLNN